jgi:hypothetical protein
VNPFTLNPWVALGIAAALLSAGAASGYWLDSNIKGVEIADLKTKAAETRANGAESAVKDLTAAAGQIKTAADQYAGIQDTLGPQLAQIRKDMKNAKPLPADCRPDTFRVRNLDAAIDAANAAAAR